MGERAKVILNEYSARELLKRETLDLDKFYTADLKLFVEVAKKEIKSLNKIIEIKNNRIQQLMKRTRSARIDKAIEYVKSKKAIINTDYIRIFDLFEIDEQGYTDELLNILQGSDKE